MQNGGYAYPVTGIFLGKNNFGYKDESETLVTHSSERKGPTMAELESKYAQALPEEVPAEDVVIQVPEMAKLPKGRRKRGDRSGRGPHPARAGWGLSFCADGPSGWSFGPGITAAASRLRCPKEGVPSPTRGRGGALWCRY